jgi:hypothetical protein
MAFLTTCQQSMQADIIELNAKMGSPPQLFQKNKGNEEIAANQGKIPARPSKYP